MKTITVNKKALHNYEIIEKMEAGMALRGSEVKSIRAGRVNLKDAYVSMRGGEAYLLNSHIAAYDNAGYSNHEPERERKLLLHRSEIRRWDQKVKERGWSIVALRMYFNDRGYVKVEIALAKGRRSWQKKQKIKERDIQREVDRELKEYR